MRRAICLSVPWAVVCALTGCGDSGTGGTPELLPVEIFTWGDQPVSFAPPPAPWARSRAQNGGQQGVDFIKRGSVGERIWVVEQFFVGNRDRCARIRELLAELDNLDKKTFRRKMQLARLYAQTPFNRDEQRWIEITNHTLDRAEDAFLRGDSVTARRELSKALEQAARIQYALGEVVDRAIFTAENATVFRALEVEEPQPAEVAGEPALRVDFTYRPRSDLMHGRELYVLHNNRLFVIRFQGLEENIPLFESVLETVSFPAGRCVH